ncbi:pPIWI_RE_Z domain-containing protein [Fibrella aquatilis]|uniref:pPIWI-RE three-gene island domain-containing protein n=1 Tax=Fibrella aquatilis TaxID=2817059 RepID=A0A939G8P9_9BACT|nr:hypothetical protein [Fibrella aquatilis]MBO0932684.1 hypothetical protein [Fibrella aquatilis]
MNSSFVSSLSVATVLAPARFGWQEPLATRLRHQHRLAGQSANRLLNIELGLFLVTELLPMAPPEALPDLLNGHGPAYEQRPVWSPKQHRLLSRARALLLPYQSRSVWFSALEKYEAWPADTRLFSLGQQGSIIYSAPNHIQRERLTLFWRAVV